MNKWSKTIIPSSFVKEMRHSDKVKKVHIVILDKGKERTFQMSAAFTIPHVSRIHHTTCQLHSPYHMSAGFTIPKSMLKIPWQNPEDTIRKTR